MRSITVIGGGISGLSVAYYLRKFIPGVTVTIFEQKQRWGGWLHTEWIPTNVGDCHGFLFERGARGIRPGGNGTAAMALIEDLHLQNKAICASKSSKNRFIWHNDKLHKLSPSLSTLMSPLVAMLPIAMLLDALLPSKKIPSDDISVRDLISCHLGKKAADILVDAVMGGIYAGDVRQLSSAATLPYLWQLNQRYGSIARGVVLEKLAAKKRDTSVEQLSDFAKAASKSSSVSFVGGMCTLPEAIAASFGNDSHVEARLGVGVTNINKQASGFTLQLTNGEIATSDIIISAVDNPVSLLPPHVRSSVSSIPTASVVTACLGYTGRDHIAEMLASSYGKDTSGGFGYLIPAADRGAGSPAEGVLGVVWDSSVFPAQNAGRHNTPQTRLSVMMGGAMSPSLIDESDEQVQQRALRVVKQHLGVTTSPDVCFISRAKNAIPQYNVGHLQRVAGIRAAAASCYGSDYHIIGNSCDGVGVADCIHNAKQLAERIATQQPTLR